MTSSSRSGRGCLSVLGTLVVLGAAIGGAYYYFRVVLGGTSTMPMDMAKVVPQSAIATGYVITKPMAWAKVANWGIGLPSPSLQDTIKKVQDSLIPGQSIDYAQDIEPWIDGAMMAFVPTDGNREGQLKVLVILGVKNKEKAQDFVKKIQNQPTASSQTQTVSGISVTETRTSNGKTLITAFLENRLVISADRLLMNNAIAAYQGQRSYADNPKVKALINQPLSLQSSVIFVQIPNYPVFIQNFYAHESSNLTSLNLSTASLQSLQEIESFTAGIALANRGFHLQGQAHLSPRASLPMVSPSKANLLSHFPENTLALVSGQGIEQGWKKLVQESDHDPQLQTGIAQIRQQLSMASLDADRDVFGWMNGEYAIGLVNLAPKSGNGLSFGGMILLSTDDRSTGEQTLDKLNKIGRTFSLVNISQRKFQDTTLTEWTVPLQGVMMSYGWLDRNALVMTFGSSYEAFTMNRPVPLVKSDRFRSITQDLPQNNLGYAYLDIELIMAEFNQLTSIRQSLLQSLLVNPVNPGQTALLNQMQEGLDLTGQLLNTLQGAALTVTLPEARTSQVDMMLTLKESKESSEK